MSQPLHIIICGEKGVGKSTLINKLLQQNKRPVYGFVTKKLPADENGVSKVHIHPANAAEWKYTADNYIGSCSATTCYENPVAFDTIGVRLLDAPHEGLLLMDELGFLESEAHAFCNKVICSLNGDIPVLAAVKVCKTPFLQIVKTHRNARLFFITHENRDALYAEHLKIIKEWNSL